MSFRGILSHLGLLLAGITWPVAVNQVAVRGSLDQRAHAAEDALGGALRTRQAIDAAKQARVNLAAAEQEVDCELAQVRPLLPDRVDRDAALSELRAAAAARGVELLSWRWAGPKGGETWQGVRLVRLQATLEGPTRGVVALIHPLLGRRALTAVSLFDLYPLGRPGMTLSELEIDLFELPSDQPPPAVP